MGCGTVSRLFYAPAIEELRRRQRIGDVTVCDLHPQAADELGGTLKAHVCPDLDSGLAKQSDLVIIATPPALHRPQVERALAVGCHVLCEKPLASRSTDAIAMKDAALSADRVLAVGHYKRFFPAAQQIKSLIHDQSLGKLRSIRLHEGGKFGWPVQNDSFFKKDKTPGGVLFDLGIHALDLLVAWLGNPTLERYWDDAAGGLEANAKVAVRWDQHDCRANLFFSRDWDTAMRWRFEFERATVDWTVNDADHLQIRLSGQSPYSLVSTLGDTHGRPADTHPQSFTRHIEHVIDAIAKGSPLRTSLDDSIGVLKLIEACYSRATMVQAS